MHKYYVYDQVDELLHDGDVRLLDIPLQQTAQPLLTTRRANGRLSGSGRWQIEVSPDAVQSGRIGEIGELDLAAELRSGLSRQSEADGSVHSNRDALRLGGHCDQSASAAREEAVQDSTNNRMRRTILPGFIEYLRVVWG